MTGFDHVGLTRPASQLVTVFGGSGFLGRHVVRALAKRGYRIRVAVRRPDLAQFLQPLGRVGQIIGVQANLRNPASIARAVEHADIVVNLVGILQESGSQSFQRLQAEGAAEVARAAAALRGSEPGRIDLVQPADGRVRVLVRPDGVKSRPAPEVVEERVGDRVFRVDAGGFWQVHRLAARTLTSLVSEEIAAIGGLDPEALHLDLYGGVGLFAATLGDLGGPSTRVVSVESDPRATEHAGENLAEWIGARAETARADRFVAKLAADASERERERLGRGVVLLDPPRAGAGREVVEGIAALAPSTVVYVACDPVALARDLSTFADLGYRADRGIRGVDLFPHSHHVEAVAVLRR